jgi:protein-tyrosine phosphatase
MSEFTASSPPIGVLFVCLGNICRSPMAEGMFRQRIADADVSHRFEVDSAGTGAYHAGERPDHRTIAVLERHGEPAVGRARQVTDADYARFQYIFAMDHSNHAYLTRRCPDEYRHRIHLMLECIGQDDVPDPYYGRGGDGFETVHELLHRALEVWLPRMLADEGRGTP